MQQGEYKLVPFLGINTEPLNDQSPDGLCSKIFNLKPKGVEGEPYWVPFEVLGTLNNGTTDFSYEHGIENITGAFWQIRNYVGEFKDSDSTSLKRLVVLCDKADRHAIDIIDPSDWSIAKSYSLEEGTYSMTFTRVNEISVINLVRNGEPYRIYYLIDDLMVEQGWPDMPKVTYKSVREIYTEAEVLAGQNGGIPMEASKQYFMVRWAFKLFDNSYVKHNRTTLVEVPTGPNTDSTLPEFTMTGYDVPLENKTFWEAFISGVSVFATQPKATEKEAIDEFAYYEVGFFPFLDKKPQEEWDTSNDPNIIRVTSNYVTWLTQQSLGIDNFTHHKFAANVVDSYNSRVLLGGASTDFALPRFSPSTGVIDYQAGEAYTSYYTYSTGTKDIQVDYFLNDGTPTTSVLAEYENQVTTINGIFTPIAGREFKSVSIKEIAYVPTPGLTPDYKLFPIHQYEAEINGLGNLQFDMLIKESTYNGIFISPFMVVEVKIGNVGGVVDEIILVNVTPTGTNASPFFNFSIQEQTNVLADFAVFHEVTIKTQSGTYKRVWEDTTETGQRLLFPNVIHYPDRRAINYKITVQNGVNYELVLNKKLTQHPSLNFSYVRLFPQELEYFIGGIVTATTQPDLTLNDVNQWDKNRVQASLTDQPFVFEAAASYRVGSRERDSIQGFGVNTIDISQGQFGQYPLYVFSDKSVWALEQSGDPQIAFGRIVPVDTFNGLNNQYAICNAERNVIAADKNFIYSLVGLDIQRIDRPISNHPEYKSFLNGIRMGFHKESDYEEIVFSNPAFDYSWMYNMRYSAWYQWGKSFKLFFTDQPTLYGIDSDNTVLDFDEKDTNTPIEWELETRKVNLGNRFISKRLLNSQVRSVFKQPYNENGIYNELSVDVDFEKEPGNSYNGVTYTREEEVTRDLWLKTKYGAFQAMVLKLAGKHQNNGTQIHLMELNFENRYTNRVRK